MKNHFLKQHPTKIQKFIVVYGTVAHIITWNKAVPNHGRKRRNSWKKRKFCSTKKRWMVSAEAPREAAAVTAARSAEAMISSSSALSPIMNWSTSGAIPAVITGRRLPDPGISDHTVRLRDRDQHIVGPFTLLWDSLFCDMYPKTCRFFVSMLRPQKCNRCH